MYEKSFYYNKNHVKETSYKKNNNITDQSDCVLDLLIDQSRYSILKMREARNRKNRFDEVYGFCLIIYVE